MAVFMVEASRTLSGEDGQSSEKLEKALQTTTEYRFMNTHTTTDICVEANMYI